MRLRAGAATSRGRVRELNEDVYIVQAERGVFVVCDGMGGAPAGHVASQIAAATIVEGLDAPLDAAAASGRTPGEHRRETTRFADAIRRSNQVVYQRGQADPSTAGMGTTVVGAWLNEQVASVAHVGDSRAYLWRAGRLELLTRDHSLLEALLAEGLTGDVTPGSAEESTLVRVVGAEPDVEVELREVPLRAGDYLLLCSDGLTRMVSDRAVAHAFGLHRHPQRICDRLIETANLNGGADNITVIVVEVGGGWWRRLADRWRPEATGAHDAKADLAV